jgi:hypothetical protein
MTTRKLRVLFWGPLVLLFWGVAALFYAAIVVVTVKRLRACPNGKTVGVAGRRRRVGLEDQGLSAGMYVNSMDRMSPTGNAIYLATRKRP